VVPEDGVPWRVMRRYNDFHELRAKLGREARRFPGAPFPRKTLFVQLERRRESLELWLARAIEAPSSGGPWRGPLHEFLYSGRQFIVAMPSAPLSDYSEIPDDSMAAVNLGILPASAPLEEALHTELPNSSHGQAVLLQISVPKGVIAGELLSVIAPDGSTIAVRMPAGVSAGSELQLLYDSDAGVMTPTA